MDRTNQGYVHPATCAGKDTMDRKSKRLLYAGGAILTWGANAGFYWSLVVTIDAPSEWMGGYYGWPQVILSIAVSLTLAALALSYPAMRWIVRWPHRIQTRGIRRKLRVWLHLRDYLEPGLGAMSYNALQTHIGLLKEEAVTLGMVEGSYLIRTNDDWRRHLDLLLPQLTHEAQAAGVKDLNEILS